MNRVKDGVKGGGGVCGRENGNGRIVEMGKDKEDGGEWNKEREGGSGTGRDLGGWAMEEGVDRGRSRG